MQAQVPIAGTIATEARTQGMPRPIWCKPTEGRDFSSAFVALLLVSITVVAFLSFSDRLDHWFLIPIGFCGVLVGIDAIEWLRGRLELYDPIGMIGIFGIHFFLLAPLLHVQWDSWMGGISPPPDWRDWLGYMGILNAVGLLFYRICRQQFNVTVSPRNAVWEIDKAKLRIFLPLCILVSAAAQTWFYSQVGGITGYMQARLNSGQQSAFEGMGWFFMISESAPLLIAFFVVAHLQQRTISWPRAATALLLLFALQMYFGGLRGSRSETVLLLFWVVGCIHFLVRPVPRKLILCGAAFILGFMYLYGFYKAMGSDAIEVFSQADTHEQMAQKTGRTFEALLLGDLDRADLQSFILYRLINDGRDFSYGWGRTYVAALSLWVPHWILPERLENKSKEGTEVQNGSGTYYQGSLSSKVYGLAGESMLNFGPLSVPFAFALFGLFIGWFRGLVNRLSPGDARLLLVPYGVYCCLSVVGSDLDNLTFGLAKNGFMPLLVVIVCSTRRKHSLPHEPGGTLRFERSR
jgi:hypothetical protein